MITSPAMSRAPHQFWKSVKKQVGKIVARNSSFAVWLLAHTNAASSYRSESRLGLARFFEEWKVLPYLSMPASKLPTDVEIPGGRAGWFSRVASVEVSPNKRVFELLELMKDVLREEKQPIQLHCGHYGHVDVDVLDMVLEFGLEVAEPPRQFTLNFDGWFREVIDHPRRNSHCPIYAATNDFVRCCSNDSRIGQVSWGSKQAKLGTHTPADDLLKRQW